MGLRPTPPNKDRVENKTKAATAIELLELFLLLTAYSFSGFQLSAFDEPTGAVELQIPVNFYFFASSDF
jgi:hypothetical protein